ncbi:MAG: GNAT family N-acetyltransferase [Phycisphaerae bacterium]|nr:GNAT family N-acetyltransferase [Saprospiraceae bacterium]
MEEKIRINEHLALTPFKPGDKLNLIRYLNDRVICQNTASIPFPYAASDADAWLILVNEICEKFGFTCNWAIRHAEHGMIGSIGFFMKSGAQGHFDEIGYWLAEPFRGQGIMTDVIAALCVWLFENRPALVRIQAKVYPYNPASARVLEKAGFEREGYLRKAVLKSGTLIDVILMARIRE